MENLDFNTRSRIDGLISQTYLSEFKHALELISEDLIDNEGFDEVDIKKYLVEIIEEYLG